jgi:hypothetical protein
MGIEHLTFMSHIFSYLFFSAIFVYLWRAYVFVNQPSTENLHQKNLANVLMAGSICAFTCIRLAIGVAQEEKTTRLATLCIAVIATYVWTQRRWHMLRSTNPQK